MHIYKILRADEWAQLQRDGRTKGAPIDLVDGYIHFSTADQALETAAKHFAGATDLWLAAIRVSSVAADLKWEISRGDALFPHLFSELTLDAVDWCRPLPDHLGAHVFPEQVSGHVDPSRAQFDAFKSFERDDPIEMFNLILLRDEADYSSNEPSDQKQSTGAQAYEQYAALTAPIFQRIGGEIIWRGGVQSTLIGPANENWDIAFIARYPSTHAFFEMVTDPAYQGAVMHRQAGVRTSRLIRCAPRPLGGTFG